ncbi:MAG: anhydro-N-acetylmuramic acid kinase [Nitrospinae bacterium]|nr:anhydro-N-acetylmuramic acid kinase [Nitrospinota bacterium]
MALYLGLMSGTSADAVDAAVVDIGQGRLGPELKLIRFASLRYSPALRARVLAAAEGRAGTAESCALDVDIGRAFGRAALKAMKGLRTAAIGSHGQTVWHDPARGATLQLGSGAVIAAMTGVPVWSGFRSADMAAGGQGAPLAPIVHLPMFGSRKIDITVVNIGGIANLTHIPAGATYLSQLTAYDTGPGNMLMDIATQRIAGKAYDKGGALARRGQVDERLLRRCLAHPYFRRAAPKSTGREMFGEVFFKWAGMDNPRRWNADTLAALTELTARSIAGEIIKLARRGESTDRVVVCGGGAKNGYLMERLAALLGPRVELVASGALGWPAKVIESALMALLAFHAHRGDALDLSSITGSRGLVRLGNLTPYPTAYTISNSLKK